MRCFLVATLIRWNAVAAHDRHITVPRATPRLPSRVENGTGKYRPDRLRLPFKPAVNRFRGKNRKMGKQNGKTGGNGNSWGVFPTVFTVPVFSRENSRENSRIRRSRLCYLCWKRELLFACVTTWIVNSWFTLPVFLSYTSLVFHVIYA